MVQQYHFFICYTKHVGSIKAFYSFLIVGDTMHTDQMAYLIDVAKTVTEGRSDVKFGLGCTGDQFITTKEELFKIKEKFPEALFVDMESNSIAHVCAKMNKPFVSLRIISDTPWVEDHAEQYANFWTDAPQKNFELLKEILQAL